MFPFLPPLPRPPWDRWWERGEEPSIGPPKKPAVSAPDAEADDSPGVHRMGPSEGNPPTITYSGCEYGLECIKNHFSRAHLFMTEALRFAAAGEITPEAQGKVRLAREQLLCEDDFAAAMQAPLETKVRIMKLLAATRSLWKQIHVAGLDVGMGTADDLATVTGATGALSDDAHDIDRQYRLSLKRRNP